jgi:hypothetical protein
VGAIADQPRRFTRAFRRSVERQWPFSLAALRRLRRRAERRFTRAASRLQARRGAASLLDLASVEAVDPIASESGPCAHAATFWRPGL